MLDKGLRLFDEKGEAHELKKEHFQQMIDNDGKEFKVALKFTQVIDVIGQERHRVPPAACLLSHTVAMAILQQFGENF